MVSTPRMQPSFTQASFLRLMSRLLLASSHVISAYDAAYLSLALNRNVPLVTLDRKLANAARKEGLTVLGPFAHGD